MHQIHSFSDILDLPGPVFLSFYFMCAGAAFVLALVLRYFLRFPAESLTHRPNLDPYDVAYLRGGAPRMMEAALAALVSEGLVVVNRVDGKVTMHGGQPRGLAPALSAVCDLISENSGSMRIGRLINSTKKQAKIRVEEKLAAYGLVPSESASIGLRLASAILMAAVVVLGIAKIHVGLSRERPVGFLVVATIILGIITLFFLFKSPRRSLRGDGVLKEIAAESDTLKAVARSGGSLHTSDVAMAAGLFGLGVLGSGVMEDLRMAHRKYAANSGTDYAAGCSGGGSTCSSGSSDSGGSSCGGGCGGGGCGGCGG